MTYIGIHIRGWLQSFYSMRSLRAPYGNGLEARTCRDLALESVTLLQREVSTNSTWESVLPIVALEIGVIHASGIPTLVLGLRDGFPPI
jgi:hypothetical protein